MIISCIGIGAQKAATSWLHKCLEEHPNVCTARGKETHYFSCNYENGKEWYGKHFSSCSSGATVFAEISTSYLANEQAVERIYTDLPGCVLLVSLRHPVDRAVSHIGHLHSKGFIKTGMSIRDILQKHPDIIENGLYGKYLQRYVDRFGKDRLHIIMYDDIEKNPKCVVRELYSFLGVDTSFVPTIIGQRYNSGTERHSTLFWVMNRTYLWLSHSALGRMIIGVFRTLGLRTHTVTGLIDRRQITKAYKLSDSDKEFLGQYFTDDIKLLERVLGCSLNKWDISIHHA